MADIKEKELQVQPGDSLDVYQDHLRVVDKNGVSYRAAVDDVAKSMIEDYRSSTLAGTQQSVETAINGLNSQIEDIKSQMVDFFHPVGSYYETSDSLFDPNDSWGGTWEEEDPGRVHIGAGGKYSVGVPGGEEAHKLTKDECGLSGHSHGFTQPIVAGGAHSHIPSNGQSSGWLQSASAVARIKVSSSGGGGGYNVLYCDSAVERKNTDSVAHTHTVSGGAVQSNGGADALQAHNNMQPYIPVKRWHRIA